MVEFQEDDPENPLDWSSTRKWFSTAIVTQSVFVVTPTSLADSESFNEFIDEVTISTEVFTVGVSSSCLALQLAPTYEH